MMKSLLRAFVVGLALVPASAYGETPSNSYSYGMIELPTEPSDSADPDAQFRALAMLALSRAEEEALQGSDFASAYTNRTYYGAESDSLLVYAITPQRGVFYYLPPGAYPVGSGPMLRLDSPQQVCRLQIDFASLEGGAPRVFSHLEFVRKDCTPWPADETGRDYAAEWREANLGAQFNIGNSVAEEGLVATLVAVENGAAYPVDPVGAASALLASEGVEVDFVLPLSGINETSMTAVFATNGEVLAVIDGVRRLRYDETCVVRGLDWEALTRMGAGPLPFNRICNGLGRGGRSD